MTELPIPGKAGGWWSRGKEPRDGLHTEGGVAYLAVNGKTGVTLKLRNPVALHGLFGTSGPVSKIYVAVDEPKWLVRELRRHVEEGGATGVLPAG